ncbi:MAG TPA: hydrogenase small subunit [Ktedonobacterales bacterium]|nr:hydrogenase small subunit [Ktedonobacterales bacterium]
MENREEPVKDGVWAALERRGVSRRDFLKFCGVMTGALALPMRYTPRIVRALEQTTRPALVWLEFQDCAGNTESALRASHPSFADIVLDLLSWNYHETVMAPAGKAAEKSLSDTVRQYKGKYLAVVEGSIPLSADGVYCTIGGRAAIDIAREVCGNAYATIAAGTCAAFGGIPAAAGGLTGAVGVANAVPGLKLINLSACPMNGANLAATIVHWLTFKELPATDELSRPLFAHGDRIHDNCPRRAHFDAGEFVEEWGDEGHKSGWCLYKMGCKGPATNYNCPRIEWNDGTNWPIGVGHGCVGCAQPAFWDTMTPFYGRLPSVPGFGVDITAEQVGLGVIGGVAALTAAHAVGSVIRQSRAKKAAASATAGGASATTAITTVSPDGATQAQAPDLSDAQVSATEGTKQP